MQKKIGYIIPVVAVVGLLAAGTVSAFEGRWGSLYKTDPKEMAVQFDESMQEKAELLGVSADELKAAWAEGKNMREFAEEKGIDLETLHEKMSAQHLEEAKNMLQTLVSEGKITQTQADARYELMKERQGKMQGMKKGNREGQGRGMHKGMGAGMGMFGF